MHRKIAYQMLGKKKKKLAKRDVSDSEEDMGDNERALSPITWKLRGHYYLKKYAHQWLKSDSEELDCEQVLQNTLTSFSTVFFLRCI